MNVKIDRLLENDKELKLRQGKWAEIRKDFNDKYKTLRDEIKALKDENERLRGDVLNNQIQHPNIQIAHTKDIEVDPENLPKEYLIPDEKKIKKELRDSDWTKPIEGVKVIEKPHIKLIN